MTGPSTAPGRTADSAPRFDPLELVNRFRPLYKLHSEEMWYPSHPEDELRCADLVSTKDGSVVIPALGGGEGSPADQLLCTPEGLQELANRGIHLDAAIVSALQWGSTTSPKYGALMPTDAFVLRRADEQFPPPHGCLESANYQPQGGTWFHRGAPNNPRTWLGGDASAYAKEVLTASQGLQEPVTGAWAQRHTVAGVDYVDVIYTAMLAWNGSISLLAGQGEHPNDVETVVVRLKESDLSRPVRYMFQQHGGFAWYEPPHVELNGERIVVYLARQSHECYPHPGRAMRLYGLADDVCDGAGVTWDAPVQYLSRPQGEEADGLRSAVSPTDPSTVVLVPLEELGPLWQYVRFRFLGRGPANMQPTDEDFLFQPFPLSTTKWWPEEGPAGSEPPLSKFAAEPSAPGVPAFYFDNVAPYLGPDPLPGREAMLRVPRKEEGEVDAVERPAGAATVENTVLGKEIGGRTAALAPDAPFVDWRGGIGAYLIGSINSHMGSWLVDLPDPLKLEDVKAGKLTIETLAVSGLHTLVVAPVVAKGSAVLGAFASTPQLAAAGTISYESLRLPISLTIESVSVEAAAQMITPVALPASSSPGEGWYVPYVGPLPYSYATDPFETTSAINNASIETLALKYKKMSTGSEFVDLILAFAQSVIEEELSTALRGELNAQLEGVYSGAKRVG